MHPDSIEPELEEAKRKQKQMEGLLKLKNEKYGELFIKLFSKFNPFSIKHSNDWGCYVDFNHELNFQATEGSFQEFAKETGFIPVAWWHKEGVTTIAFDKVFYPQSSALVRD